MDFGFSEEQNILRDQVKRFVKERCPMHRVREILSTDNRFDEELWKEISDLGWLALIIPEKYGGLDLGWVDLTVVLEETASGLCPLPITSQSLAATAILLCGDEQQKAKWLPEIAEGKAISTLALYDDPNWISSDAIFCQATKTANGFNLEGSKPFVNGATLSNWLFLAIKSDEGLILAKLEKDQCDVQFEPTMDETKIMGRVDLNGLSVDQSDCMILSEENLSTLTNYGAVAVTAEMVGAAQSLLDLTSNYTKERIQFGKPIGQYQGVKHRLAEMFVDIESFRSLCYFAAWAVDDSPHDVMRAVSLAKGYASDAFAQIGIDGVGLHGAIGFTAEYDAQLYLKRSKWARPMYGDSNFHLDRLASLGGL